MHRALGLPLLTLYGVGNIIGAGIYVLVGKVAGEAGSLAHLAFGLALLVAGVTAFSYMELSSRYPQAAGVSVYLYQAFHTRWLARLVGLLIVATGIVSAATLSRGFVGYFLQIAAVDAGLIILLLVATMGSIAYTGISHSAKLAALFTLVEVGGLLLIITVAAPSLSLAPLGWAPNPDLGWSGVIAGAFLAFYAYVGFEDMIDVTEEVKQPRWTLPRAILLSLIITAVLYGLVVIAAMSVASPAELAGSEAPLAMIFERTTGIAGSLFSWLGLVAIANGVLVQIIMGSRILYGLAKQGWLHAQLKEVHPEKRTPALATILVTVLIIGFALVLPLVQLAGLTSLMLLVVFGLVNAALIKLKLTQNSPAAFRVPAWVPVLGLLLNAGLMAGVLLF